MHARVLKVTCLVVFFIFYASIHTWKLSMDKLKNGWFSEENSLWPGQAFCLEVEEVLHQERSKYQDILIFQSKTYGRVLVLDGCIQFTEKDEFAYQEPIAHIPLFSHPNPKTVLVVGGGDGGVLREIGKHSSVDEIHICEIDERVIELSKEYFPQLSIGYSNPKVKVHIQDGAEFLVDHENTFDVIITDSSDPIGPAQCLFEKPYFEKLRAALKPNGIISTQGECIWLDLELIKNVLGSCRDLYPVVSYAYTAIPTYPCGQIGFVLASKNKDTKFEIPLRTVTGREADEMKLQYYDSDVHRGAFLLPRFAKKALGFNKDCSTT